MLSIPRKSAMMVIFCSKAGCSYLQEELTTSRDKQVNNSRVLPISIHHGVCPSQQHLQTAYLEEQRLFGRIHRKGRFGIIQVVCEFKTNYFSRDILVWFLLRKKG